MEIEDTIKLVRFLFKLVVCGGLALREIIIRAVNSQGDSLENLLRSKSRLRSLPKEISNQLFPAEGKVNTDIERWNIKLLCYVIKLLFWRSISIRERSAVNTLSSYREDIERNLNDPIVMIEDYRTIQDDLRTIFVDIIDSIDERRGQQLRDIVNLSGTANLDMQCAISQIRALNEFSDDLLLPLVEQFRQRHREGPVLMMPRPSLLEGTHFERNYDAYRGDETCVKSHVGTRKQRITASGQQPLNLTNTGEAHANGEGATSVQMPESIQETGVANENGPSEPNDRQHSDNRGRIDQILGATSGQLVGATSGQLEENVQETGVANENGPPALIITQHPDNRERIDGMLGSLDELIRLQNNTDENSESWQSIDTKVFIEGDTASDAYEAQTCLIQLFNNITVDVDPQTPIQEGEENQLQPFPNDVNTTGLQQSNNDGTLEHTNESSGFAEVTDLLPVSDRDTLRRLEVGDASQELIKSIMEFCIEIKQLGNGNIIIMCAGEGCVEFMVKCRTNGGIISFLKYFKSRDFQSALDRISRTLRRYLGIGKITLIPFIPEEIVTKLEAFIAEEFKRMPKNRSFALKMGFSCITDLSRLKRYLQSDKAKETLKKISGALTRLDVGQTNLVTSIDAIQMKEALKNRNDRLLYSIKI